MSFDGKVVVVTGGAQGIGLQYAVEFLAQGAHVAAIDVVDDSELRGRAEAERLEQRLRCYRVDVTDEHDVEAMTTELLGAWRRIDVLVNNAALYGSLRRAALEDLSKDEWDAAMAVNVRGVWNCVKSVVPVMRSQRSGRIVNVASTVVFTGTPMMLHYVASKGAVWAMTHAMARELRGTGVTVNTVAPGLVDNESSERMMGADKEHFHRVVAARNKERSVQRALVAEDLVTTVLFLASDGSEMVSGQTITVDGGGHFS